MYYHMCMNVCMHTYIYAHILGTGLKSRKIAQGRENLSSSIVQPYSEIKKVFHSALSESLLFGFEEKITSGGADTAFFCRQPCCGLRSPMALDRGQPRSARGRGRLSGCCLGPPPRPRHSGISSHTS